MTMMNTATDTVLGYYDLVDAADVPGLVDLFTPGATYRRPGYDPLVGHAAIERFYRDERVIREGRHTVRTVVAQDDRVAVHGEFNGELVDGRTVHLRFADFFVLAPDGRFVCRDTFFFAPLV